MAAHAGEFPVRRMCQVLRVSPSGYYDWLKRPPSQRQQANAQLLEVIRREHEASRQTYGSPRIHAALKQQGVQVGRKRVARLMQAHGLVGKGPRRNGRGPPNTNRGRWPRRTCWRRISPPVDRTKSGWATSPSLRPLKGGCI
jgi:transposase InsO family protein